MSIQLIKTRPEARVLQAGSLVICHYFGPATVASATNDFECALPVIERFGEVSFMVVFEAHLVGRPRPTVLATVEERLRWLGTKTRCSAMVVRGAGIAPTLMRTMLSGVGFIARDQGGRKVFRDVREGLSWIQAFEGQHAATTAARLADVEAVLRAPQMA